ncbi:hypothetical protein H5410_011425 [Solanum commersonii]|uniref:Uncharacterized protein n=1 Tax=Solanum commersonii TaxID=4109 RepID=A0A9J6AQ45_SOLCO|nr:hypothetical protein H5410_011425 [Solanum commersonii]
MKSVDFKKVLLYFRGGLYCLYCLDETQPFRPPFKIYISLGELKNLRDLVAKAKAKDVKLVPALVKHILDRNNYPNSVQKLFANSRIEHFTHMDMRLEFEVDLLKQKLAEKARAKDLAIKGASDMVDVENIKHITQNQTLIGDVVEKTAEDRKTQKELFYQKTGICHQPVKDSVDVVREEQDKFSQQEVAEEQDGDKDFSKELDEVLLSAQNDSDFEE